MTTNPQHSTSPRHRYSVVPRVLIFVEFDGKILLIKGAPDKPLWPNMYNGVGGHAEPGETIHHAATRELEEETGIRTDNLDLCGMVSIQTPVDTADILLFVYFCRVNSPETRSGREGNLAWFDWEHMPPADLMVPDLPILLPKARITAQTHQPFYALYTYKPDGSLQISLDD